MRQVGRELCESYSEFLSLIEMIHSIAQVEGSLVGKIIIIVIIITITISISIGWCLVLVWRRHTQAGIYLSESSR